MRIVNLNVLHGAFCGNTNYCAGPIRVALLWLELEAAKCPRVVGLQEIDVSHTRLLEKGCTTLCGRRHKLVSTRPIPAGLLAAGCVDSHLASGNTKRAITTGVNCTLGRADQSLDALKDPTAKKTERIDFTFVKPPSSCTVAFDPLSDDNRDGLSTGLFASTPAVNGPGGLVWTSDHTAVSADLSCTKG